MDHAQIGWALAQIASEAGGVIMGHYRAGCAAHNKSDGSPVTAADEEAEALILARLKVLAPNVCVVAEESAARAECPPPAARFFLVDPLDGTREFVARNGEFTVNIALIVDGAPVAGCVYAPALATLYLGISGVGAWSGPATAGEVIDAAAFRRITSRVRPDAGWVAAVSRSHGDPATEAFLARMPVTERRAIGSSLKFCLVAEGQADIYPRLASIMEWDAAAGHAVLAAAGGDVVLPDGAPLIYGRAGRGYRLDPFVAWGDRAAIPVLTA